MTPLPFLGLALAVTQGTFVSQEALPCANKLRPILRWCWRGSPTCYDEVTNDR